MVRKGTTSCVGEVKFIGPLKNKDETFYGIELLKEPGDNNGFLDGLFYFKSRPWGGIFATRKDIVKVLPRIDKSSYMHSMSSNRGGGPKLTVGTQITIKSTQQRGTIRYIGPTLFNTWHPRDTIWYGIECNNKSNSNIHDNIGMSVDDFYNNDNSRYVDTISKKIEKEKKERYAISVGDRIYFMSKHKDCLFVDIDNIIYSAPRCVVYTV